MFKLIKNAIKCIFGGLQAQPQDSSDRSIYTATATSSYPLSNRTIIQPQRVVHQYQVVAIGDKNKLLIGQTLGKGAFSVVKEGISFDTLRRVAVKIVDQAALRCTRDGQIGIQREISIMKLLKGKKNIIELNDVFCPGPQSSEMFLSMELAVCSAEILMKLGPGGKLADSQVANFAFQTLLGLRTMHSLGVVHRDIKPDNLMIMPDGVLKIGDFGVAEFLGRFSNDDAVSKTSGSPIFQAPEIARGDFFYSGEKVDVWALGITVYRLLSGTVPFNGNTTFQLYHNIVSGDYPRLDFVSRDGEDFISKALTANFYRRPTVEGLLKNSWMLLGRESLTWSDEKKEQEGWVRIPGQNQDIWNTVTSYNGKPEVMPTSPMSPSPGINQLFFD